MAAGPWTEVREGTRGTAARGPWLRRGAVGLASGAVAGAFLAGPGGLGPAGVVLGAVVGLLFGLLVRHEPGAWLDAMFSSAALGVPLWALVHVIARPLLAGEEPRWTAEEMRGVFPALPAWLLYGIALGFGVQWVGSLVARWRGPEPVYTPPPRPVRARIVILGGGFAGTTAARELERRFGADPGVAITLVSETNALLFTPMLAEVAASSVEATHISTPLRTALARTTVVRARVAAVDTVARTVRVVPTAGADGSPSDLPYDHLVLALGAVSNYLGMDGVKSTAFDFKSLGDAIRIRNHVIDVFERADAERDPARRAALLTFVVAGGGFAGVELAGGLNDFARGMLADYPNIPPGDVRVVLVHSRERILPELSEPLGVYAQRRMAERGVTFLLGARVKDARPGAVVLGDGTEIPNATLVWTAGTAPNPLLHTLPLERDKRGAVLVDGTLRAPGLPGVWALGDCAVVPNAATGAPAPPTAQFALREARCLARNLAAAIDGGTPRPFAFRSLGALCVVGHQTACAEIRGRRFSGLLAWFMWRAIYLGKLPGSERKVRVLVDWIIELFFPRDIVQTIDLERGSRGDA